MTRNTKELGTRKIFLSPQELVCRTTPGETRAPRCSAFCPGGQKAQSSFSSYSVHCLIFFSFLWSWFPTCVHVLLLCCLCFHCKATTNRGGTCAWQELNKYLNEWPPLQCECCPGQLPVRASLLGWPLAAGERKEHGALVGTDAACPESSCLLQWSPKFWHQGPVWWKTEGRGRRQSSGELGWPAVGGAGETGGGAQTGRASGTPGPVPNRSCLLVYRI